MIKPDLGKARPCKAPTGFEPREHLSPEQIAERCEHKDGLANIRAINALFRAQDESHLWPIAGKFNATERAIRRVRRAQRDGLVLNPGLEYALTLDAKISQIVNDESNW